MAGVEQSTFPFIVDVDQLSLEGFQHTLFKQIKIIKNILRFIRAGVGSDAGVRLQYVCGVATYRLIKIHIVREDVNVGVEDTGLANHLFQDVSYTSREDEQRDAVLMQVAKEKLVTLPVKTSSF